MATINGTEREGYKTKDERNERYRVLRAAGTKGLVKYSDPEPYLDTNNKEKWRTEWYVAWSR